MKVKHGSFEMIVTEHHLYIADESSVVQGVSSICVSQAMRRESFQVALMRCSLYCPLDIPLVAPPTNERSRARVTANSVGRKEPSPALRSGGPRVFL